MGLGLGTGGVRVDNRTNGGTETRGVGESRMLGEKVRDGETPRQKCTHVNY